MAPTEHIVASFDRDLEGIQANIMRMGGLVEDAIAKSAHALEARDPDLARPSATAMPPSTRWTNRSTKRPRASSRSVSRSRAICA
jgi:hypothetical protein